MADSEATATVIVQAKTDAAAQLNQMFMSINASLQQVVENTSKMAQAQQNNSDKTKESSFNFVDLAAKLYLVEVAFRRVTDAFDAAFKFGEAGAAAQQLTTSFDMVINSVGGNVEVLQKLREATKGTVSDIQLMSSVNLMLSGTTQDVAKSMLDAAPQLAEIAKAANAMNPQLGTTSEMFDMISEAIKRERPLMLNRLGLHVSLAEAEKNFADKLGVSVKSLTDADKVMALLNATEESGQRLIDQLGGKVDSATDSFEKFKTDGANATMMLQEQYKPAIENVVVSLDKFIFGHYNAISAQNSVNESAAHTSTTYEEYSKKVDDAAAANGFFYDSNGQLLQSISNTNLSVMDAGLVHDKLSKSAFDAANAFDVEDARANNLAKDLNNSLSPATETVAQQAADLKDQLAILSDNIKGTAGKDIDKLSASYADLGSQQQDLTDKLRNYTETQGQAYGPSANLGALTDKQAAANYEVAKQYGILNDVQAKLTTQQGMLGKAMQEGADPKWINYLQGSIFTLNGTMAEQQVKIDEAKKKYAELGIAVSGASGGYVDNSKKIDDTKTKLDEVTAKLDAEKEAFRRNTAEMIYNATARELQAKGEGNMLPILGQLALNLGLVDQKTANMNTSVSNAVSNFENGKTNADQLVSSLEGLYKNTNDINGATENTEAAQKRAEKSADELEKQWHKNHGKLNDEVIPKIEDLVTTTGTKLVDANKNAKDSTVKLGDQWEKDGKEGGALYVYRQGIQGLNGEVQTLIDLLNHVPSLPTVKDQVNNTPKGYVAPYDGGQASGGPVSAGHSYLVGESGQELFVPKQDGTIIPNHQLGGGGYVIHNILTVGGNVIYEAYNTESSLRGMNVN